MGEYALRLKVPEYDSLDAEELENAGIPKVGAQMAGKKVKRADGADAEGAEEVKEKKKRKKNRKIRYPKNFDPENPGPMPDPERWLPKHERTEYKKKMRKRDKNLLRGPQGAMVTDDQAFRKHGPSTAQVEVSKDNSKRQAPRKKQGKK